MKVAYLGPKGTFSEEAAVRYFAETDVDLVEYKTILDVLEAVSDQKADKGIVPIENAIEGTITMTTDGLSKYNVWIDGEAVLPVALHLLAVKGVQLEDIKEVWSISPALAQCREFTRKHGFETTLYSSTAQAAETLKKEERHDVGAVASEWAAKTFDLEIIERDIQELNGNSTRFIVVSNRMPIQAVGQKSMLLITPTEDRPGLLAIILNVFSSLGINLSWIESRPTKKKLGTYRFFVETRVGIQDESLQKAIKVLETYGHHVRVLGSYESTQL